MTTQIQASVSASVTLSTSSSITNPSHASTRMEGGQAVFENDNYKIVAGHDNTVTITNKHTGDTYQVWGDPHVKIDGQQAFNFWGTTTLRLEDGTKVTIQTTPWSNNPNATLASKVTITNGDYGAQITGIDTNSPGTVQVHEAAGWGKLLDWAVDDGNTMFEHTAGKDFVGVDAQGNLHHVDQAWVDQSDLTKGGSVHLPIDFPPGQRHIPIDVPPGQRHVPVDIPPGQRHAHDHRHQLIEAFRDAFRLLGGLLEVSFLGGFLSGQASAGAAGEGGSALHFEPRLGGNVFLDASASVTVTSNVSLTLGRWAG